MARPFRQQVDEGILDHAAGLFARRGYTKTSVQDVAAAVGLSKAGLLHHFPSKEALHAAVLALAEDVAARVVDEVAGFPVGEERDRRALEFLVDVAAAHPGVVALMLSPAAQQARDPGDPPAVRSATPLRAFGIEAADPADPGPGGDEERLVRVVGALGALAVLTLAAHAEDRSTAWRRHIVATCLDALGHRGPGAARPTTPSGEA
ncbi:TetR/AcrR family transcriptional regulator [Blastococcus sp. SYSU D00695]